MNLPLDSQPLTIEPVEAGLHDLAARVQSLEVAVTRLEDTHAIEDRVVARLTDRMPQAKVAAERDTGIIEERVMARIAERLPPAAPPPADDPPRPEPAVAHFPWGGGWASWLFVDMFREGRLLVKMTFDRRYRMAWTTRIIAIVFLPAILTAHWWMPVFFFWFPLMWFTATAGLCINLVNLVLAFALYKALSREVRRYDERARH